VDAALRAAVRDNSSTATLKTLGDAAVPASLRKSS
jgi:hypothetical protein